MLTRIAWRNIWRNSTRSLVVIFAIALGLCAGVFIMSFSWGMNNQHVKEAIQSQLSHIQIHHPKFKEDQNIKYVIPHGIEKISKIAKDSNVIAVAPRLLVQGMVASPNASSGVIVQAIDPAKETEVTLLNQKLIAGKYFQGIKRNPILIGEKLAEKLKVKVRNKIVITFQNPQGDITAAAFRVVGIYKSRNTNLDQTKVYVNLKDINNLIGWNEANEIAILLNEKASLNKIAEKYKKQYSKLKVETWKELSPELQLIIDSFGQYMYIFITIILLALAFGIINTMLMAVLERVKELGVLMAIGLNKRKVFFMIMLETIYLAAIGGPLGMLLAFILISFFGSKGIDLSIVSEGLSAYGYDHIVYPSIEPRFYLEISIMAILAAIVSAIYPAFKALKLNPSEAIRKI